MYAHPDTSTSIASFYHFIHSIPYITLFFALLPNCSCVLLLSFVYFQLIIFCKLNYLLYVACNKQGIVQIHSNNVLSYTINQPKGSNVHTNFTNKATAICIMGNIHNNFNILIPLNFLSASFCCDRLVAINLGF